MRSVLAVLTFSLLTLQDLPRTPSNTRIAQVPDGTIAQKTYLNDALDISFRIRDGWTITLIPAGTVLFAPEQSATDPVNTCSRALFSSEPIRAAKKEYGPQAIYFVFDPACFPGAPLPRSTKDRPAVATFARRVVRALAHTPYISPNGADFGGFDAGGRAFVTITAEKNVTVSGSNPVHVNTLLMVTESNGYWVVVAEMVDDQSKAIMQAGGVDISERR